MLLAASLIINALLLAVMLWLLARCRGRHSGTSGAEKDAQPLPAAAPQPTDKGLLLLVGMDAETTNDLKTNLKDDYRLEFVDDSTHAPEMVALVRPVLVISEFLMPGMDGADLCHALSIREETRQVPVVFLTALAHSADIVYGLEAGAQDYVTKPYDIDVLKARIQKAIGNHPVADLSRQTESGSATDPRDKAFLDKLNKVIIRHLSDSDFFVNDICKEMGMSRTALFTRIKAVTDHSPNDYLRIYRLNEARRLLEARLWTIAEVAVKVGYNDPKYFSTSFKKQFGISPSKV